MSSSPALSNRNLRPSIAPQHLLRAGYFDRIAFSNCQISSCVGFITFARGSSRKILTKIRRPNRSHRDRWLAVSPKMSCSTAYEPRVLVHARARAKHCTEERRRGLPPLSFRTFWIRPWWVQGEYLSKTILNLSWRVENVLWSNPHSVTSASSCQLLNSWEKGDWLGWRSAARRIFPCLRRRDSRLSLSWKEGRDFSWSVRTDRNNNSSSCMVKRLGWTVSGGEKAWVEESGGSWKEGVGSCKEEHLFDVLVRAKVLFN